MRTTQPHPKNDAVQAQFGLTDATGETVTTVDEQMEAGD